jgi:hypothetical protein
MTMLFEYKGFYYNYIIHTTTKATSRYRFNERWELEFEWHTAYIPTKTPYMLLLRAPPKVFKLTFPKLIKMLKVETFLL